MDIIFNQLKESDLEFINRLDRSYHDFSVSKNYSFVAFDDSKIIGYIISNRSMIRSFSVKSGYVYDVVGKTLLTMTLSKLYNREIDILSRADNKEKLNLLSILKFKIINIQYTRPEPIFRLRLDNIHIKFIN